jgi:hypothetical protein
MPHLTANPSGELEFTHGFWVEFIFWAFFLVFNRLLFVLLSYFLMTIVLPVFRYTVSDCPFGIVKLLYAILWSSFAYPDELGLLVLNDIIRIFSDISRLQGFLSRFIAPSRENPDLCVGFQSPWGLCRKLKPRQWF